MRKNQVRRMTRELNICVREMLVEKRILCQIEILVIKVIDVLRDTFLGEEGRYFRSFFDFFRYQRLTRRSTVLKDILKVQ